MPQNIEFLQIWIKVVLVTASIAATSFPIVYSLSPWKTHMLGRLFMAKSISLAVTLDLSTIFTFWRPSLFTILLTNAIAITGIAVTTSGITYWVWKMNFYHGKKGKHDYYRQGLRRP